MRRKRPFVLQRKPIFFGCEGESEQAYGQLLNDLLRQANLPFHLDVVNLNPGAGDPVARLRRAQQEIARRRMTRADFHLKMILMDSDQFANNPTARINADRSAHELDISIIWQDPCHEAMLLRHLEGFTSHRPPTSAAACQELLSEWREYRKPMSRIGLARRIGIDAVKRAATVEPALRDFLCQIRLLP
jgi:hypothetical protein